ncbi:MAG: leucine-rich repeat domain-containing protein [Crocinitomicaceae bacterium]|nr:leucine-rich repeat domain-containing protein [Crocinitomicaceae bacterium]
MDRLNIFLTLFLIVILQSNSYGQDWKTYGSIEEAVANRDSAGMLILSDISSNQNLTDLAKLTHLHTLWIKSVGLKEIPNSILQLTELSVLDLSDNNITTIPSWIGELTNLEKIDLSDNQLSTLPNTMSNLSNLAVLYLQNNELEVLMDDIDKLVRLRGLDVGGNKLDSKEIERIRRLLPRLNYLNPRK